MLLYFSITQTRISRHDVRHLTEIVSSVVPMFQTQTRIQFPAGGRMAELRPFRNTAGICLYMRRTVYRHIPGKRKKASFNELDFMLAS